MIIDKELEVDPNWIPGKALVPLLKDKGDLVGAEIGLYDGSTCFYLLCNLPNIKHYGIDPYLDYHDWYPGGYLNQDIMNDVKSKMLARTAHFSDRFVHLQTTSDDAASYFPDESLDYVFIDGLHTYDQVLKDCRHYWAKLKKGGVFAGHDFTVIEGVRNAVLHFRDEVKAPKIHLEEMDLWYWIKE